jgi:hypothetical protein
VAPDCLVPQEDNNTNGRLLLNPNGWVTWRRTGQPTVHVQCALRQQPLSHPVLEGKPNANHVRARISYSRTQQLHNMDIITQCSK